MLRYSMEAVLALPSPGGGGPLPVIAYLPRDAAVGQGDTVSFTRPPAPLVRPGKANRYALSMGRKGITHAVRLGPDEYTVTPSPSSSLRRDFRRALAEKIDRLFEPGTAGLLKGLYFGNKNHIPKETVLSFTRAGVLHILAASGSHLATLAFLPLTLLGLARLDRRGAFLVTAAFLALYLYVTDLPVSLQRAFIMFALGGLHLLLDHRRNPLNVLYHAAAAVLLIQPWELYSLGFQLTFGATAGILLFYGNCRDSLSSLPPVLRNPLALTVSAQALVFPVLALRLGEVNIVSLAANLVVVPLVQLVFAASAALLALESALELAEVGDFLDAGQVIFIEGEPAEQLYLLERGWVKARIESSSSWTGNSGAASIHWGPSDGLTVESPSISLRVCISWSL